MIAAFFYDFERDQALFKFIVYFSALISSFTVLFKLSISIIICHFYSLNVFYTLSHFLNIMVRRKYIPRYPLCLYRIISSDPSVPLRLCLIIVLILLNLLISNSFLPYFPIGVCETRNRIITAFFLLQNQTTPHRFMVKLSRDT